VKTEDDDTRLRVLTWRGAFSATEALLVDLDRLTDAVFIGEPASSKPNSYGDAYRMPMPNSGISIRSSLYWNQLAGQSKASWTAIDVSTPYTFADYAAGRDPALETALSWKPGPSLQDRLLEAAKSGGPDAVRAALRAYRSDVANRHQNLGQLAVQAALGLDAAKHAEAAVAVAETATREFPRSVDAWNVLAHLAERKQPDVALRAAKRALELDPNNRSARSLVERVQAAKK
jgi:tetratricopeptide (TPR) repeat protein